MAAFFVNSSRSTLFAPREAMVGVLVSAFILSACGTLGSGDGAQGPGNVAGTGDGIGGLIANMPNAVPGPDPKTLIGRPVAALEALTGTPALTRTEGDNEFRRYDLGLCRVYAVVTPAGGTVASLTSGPAVAGNPKPTVQQCTARLPK